MRTIRHLVCGSGRQSGRTDACRSAEINLRSDILNAVGITLDETPRVKT